jgi:hypothetical protein
MEPDPSDTGHGNNEMVMDTKSKSEHLDNSSRDDQPLSFEHSSYLVERHGTTDLNPLPSQDPSDPLNWPAWKVSQSFSARETFLLDLTLSHTF